MITYKETKNLSDSQLRPLYEAVGWVTYTTKFSNLGALLTGCQLVYTAWDQDTLVGLVRTVGDGVSIQYVQDLLVLPGYQKQGIGTKLLNYVLEHSSHIRQLILVTDASPANQHVIDFYRQLGIIPLEENGARALWRLR